MTTIKKWLRSFDAEKKYYVLMGILWLSFITPALLVIFYDIPDILILFGAFYWTIHILALYYHELYWVNKLVIQQQNIKEKRKHPTIAARVLYLEHQINEANKCGMFDLVEAYQTWLNDIIKKNTYKSFDALDPSEYIDVYDSKYKWFNIAASDVHFFCDQSVAFTIFDRNYYTKCFVGSDSGIIQFEGEYCEATI